jgi:hypothetical protein
VLAAGRGVRHGMRGFRARRAERRTRQ